ncbi:MAG: histidine kinase dimerization/phospho-acceptor domain-containing protein, partial [Planctomycetota bacterium]
MEGKRGSRPAMRTVTLCEPSGPLRQGLAQRLEGEGISVRAFADGQAAWDAIHGEPPDALITAHRLPGLSGLDLLALITGASMGIPTVFIASGDNERVVAEALNLGAACCLFQGSADRLHAPLLRALERIFDRLRLMDENRLLLEELLEQNDRLERLVEERTAKLARAVEELRSFDETRSTFLSLMGHEIRTPLTSILGFTELLRGGGYDGEEELREILERIESAGGALRRFVEGSLELFEWTSGRVALEARRVEMRELLEGILTSEEEHIDWL